MKASIIIPVWNGREYLSDCLGAVLAQEYLNVEVIAVDNASTDGSADFIAEHYSQVCVIRNERNLGFAGGCNVGLEAAQGDVLVLLNQDTVVRPNWLSAFIETFEEQGDVGVLGAKILKPDGITLSHAGGYLEWPLALGQHVGADEVDHGQYDTVTDVEYVTGASLAIRRETLDEVGLLDERFYPAFYEDVDLCWRARQADWRVSYQPQAVAIHDEASSTRHHWLSRHYYHYRNRLLFLFKHFSNSEILREFIPAEKERLLHLPPDELRAGHVALTEILSMRALIERDILIKDAAIGTEQILNGIQSLREQIVGHFGADPALQRPRSFHEVDSMVAASTVCQNCFDQDLLELWEINEPEFVSKVPILGRWIVRFRELWNSVSTKWYVRPMIIQQVKFNGAVVRALDRLQAHFWDDDALLCLLAERCGKMAARISELERQLKQKAD
jgi:GT2 family glycosyltransferase